MIHLFKTTFSIHVNSKKKNRAHFYTLWRTSGILSIDNIKKGKGNIISYLIIFVRNTEKEEHFEIWDNFHDPNFPVCHFR